METIKEFFTNLTDTFINFLIKIWNAFVDILALVFPRDFAGMMAIVIAIIIFFAIFRAVITKK